MLHTLASEDSDIPIWLSCITHVTNFKGIYLGMKRC
jgi:hypothetical protein